MAFARRTDSPVFIGRALLDRTEVLGLLGKHEEAHAAADEALVVAEAKGGVVSAARPWLCEMALRNPFRRRSW